MTVLVWRGKCLPMRPGKGSFPGVTCSPEAKPALSALLEDRRPIPGEALAESGRPICELEQESQNGNSGLGGECENAQPGSGVAEMLRKITRWRPFSMSRNQAEYIWLILLASLVGVLGAFGNLMLREAIRVFMWVFQMLEWNALQIPRGIPFSLLIPLVLVSGGLVIMLLDLLLPGDIMGYGFPTFLEKIHLG